MTSTGPRNGSSARRWEVLIVVLGTVLLVPFVVQAETIGLHCTSENSRAQDLTVDLSAGTVTWEAVTSPARITSSSIDWTQTSSPYNKEDDHIDRLTGVMTDDYWTKTGRDAWHHIVSTYHCQKTQGF